MFVRRQGVPQPAKAHLALRRDLTQRELARRVGVSEAWVGRVLNGVEEASPELREAIARELGLPVEALFRAHLVAAS